MHHIITMNKFKIRLSIQNILFDRHFCGSGAVESITIFVFNIWALILAYLGHSFLFLSLLILILRAFVYHFPSINIPIIIILLLQAILIGDPIAIFPPVTQFISQQCLCNSNSILLTTVILIQKHELESMLENQSKSNHIKYMN